MKKIFLFLLVPFLAFGEEKPDTPPIIYYSNVQAELVMHASHVNYLPKVNVVTGEYCEEATDLIVAGIEPLSFRRFYNHFAPNDFRLGCWRINPETSLVANFELDSMTLFASVGQENGNVYFLNKKEEGVTIPRMDASRRSEERRDERQKRARLARAYRTVSRFKLDPGNDLGYTNFNSCEMNGKKDPGNISLTYWKDYDPEKKSNFAWKGFILDGAGKIREFKTPHYSWLKRNKFIFRHGSSIYQGNLLPEQWTPYPIPIYVEELPNGNIIKYSYAKWRDDSLSPQPVNLVKITAYDRNEEVVLGSIDITYTKSSWKNVHFSKSLPNTPEYKENIEENKEVIVKGSDGRKCFYQNSERSKSVESVVLKKVKHPSGECHYSYIHDTLLTEVDLGNGRRFQTQYDPTTYKVLAQLAPLGANGEMLPLYRFSYDENKTVVTGAEGAKTLYYFDDKKRVIAIAQYLNEEPYRVERYVWDQNSRLLENRIEDDEGNIYYKKNYEYDERGNILKEMQEELGGINHAIHRTFSKDGFNCKLSEEDGSGKLTLFTYEPNSNRLFSKMVYAHGRIVKRTFYTYNMAAVCIKKVVDDGSRVNPEEKANVTYCKITCIKPKEEIPCYGLPEEIEEKTIDDDGQEVLLKKICYTYHPSGKIEKEEHFDSHNDFCYSIINTYDSKERLISTTDPLGNKTHYIYDDNNNMIRKEGPGKEQIVEWSYDLMNRPIEKREQILPGIFLKEKTEYDKLGRIIAFTNFAGKTTHYEYDSLGRQIAIIHPDGTSEKKEYDILGHLFKEIDGKGYQTTKIQNSRGDPLLINYPDGSEEHFIYNLNGSLASYIDRNGAKRVYAYDLFGRQVEVKIFSANGKLLKQTSSSYNTFFKTKKTDGLGAEIKYTYDCAGRKVSKTKGSATIFYTYDACGRRASKQIDNLMTSYKYDLLGQEIERKTADSAGNIYALENRCYDERGNLILKSTPRAKWSFSYNGIGKISLATDPLGQSHCYYYTFDNGRLEETTHPNGSVISKCFDSKNREYLTLVKDINGNTLQKKEFHYDANDNCILEKQCLFKGIETIGSLTKSWKYGPCNRLEECVDRSGKKTSYSYDARGRLSAIQKPDGTTIFREYDTLGRLARLYSYDIDYFYTYDSEDHLLAVEDQKTNTSTQLTYDLQGNVIRERLATRLTLESTYDKSSRRISLTLPTRKQIHWQYLGPYVHKVTKDLFTATFTKRDAAGNPEIINLPGSVLQLSWDPLGRLVSLRSPFYKSALTYDSSGCPLTCDFEDPEGACSEVYSYNALEQLLSEDGREYERDTYGRILYAGEDRCGYDENGNLIAKGDFRFFYDSQDRLIAIKNGVCSLEYSYDPFHRRLSKTIYKNGKQMDSVIYLWDGDKEIGSLTQSGKMKELRVFGDNFPLLYELDDKPFLPIHDHFGSLVTLVDMAKSKPVATYRYTLFGEALLTHDLSPWRFKSMRLDTETGFYYSDRRYYCPDLGYFITSPLSGAYSKIN